MAAVFYTPDPNVKIFRTGLEINNTVRVPFLDNMIGEAGHCIVSDVSVSNNDTIQFFMTFDDFISYFYFGKGLGDLVIRGMLFMDCSGDMPGVNKFYSKVSEIRGTEVDVSFGNVVFTCVLVGFSTTAVSEPVSVTEFTLQLKIIDHSLGSKNFNTSC